MNHVPYPGLRLRSTICSADIDLFFNELATSVELHKSGKAKIPRLPPSGLPNCQTSDHERGGLAGLYLRHVERDLGAAKTPPAIVAKLNAAVNDVLKMPEVRALRSHTCKPAAVRRADMAKVVKPIPSGGAR